MTFNELLAEIYLITNRPDLVSESKSALKSATLKAHQSDYYLKDLHEVGLLWSPIAYQQSLDYRTIVPRWRAFKFLRKYDSTGSTPGDFFALLTPEETLDSYGVNREDVCYLAGEQIEIRSSTEDTYMLLGCYRQPDITEATYSSWAALDHPWAIIYEAARIIFNATGKKEEASGIQREVLEQIAALRNSNITAGGF